MGPHSEASNDNGSLQPLDLARPMPHPCEAAGCANDVEFDDEPFCLEHSDEEGSYSRGYSFRRKRADDN